MVSNSNYDADFYRRRNRNTRPSAEVIEEVTQERGPFSSVGDVGCGVGTFLDVFREHSVRELLGFEGQWADPSLPNKVPAPLQKDLTDMEIEYSEGESREWHFTGDQAKVMGWIMVAAGVVMIVYTLHYFLF